jgi:DNA-binding GntR family transcriptional regulator
VTAADGLSAASALGGPPRSRVDGDAVAYATESLRSLIVKGKIAPGAELSQVSLARAIGVSTTPLREALRQLEAEGFVESRRNRRPRVTPFDPADLETVYCNRILLEALGVSLTVPTMSDEQLGDLAAQLATMRASGTDGDVDVWDTAHERFHIGLVSGCNASLRQQIVNMMARSDRYRRMSILGDEPVGWRIGETEHAEILTACEERQANGAALLLARHLTRSALRVLANMAPEADLVAVRTALGMVAGWAGGANATD